MKSYFIGAICFFMYEKVIDKLFLILHVHVIYALDLILMCDLHVFLTVDFSIVLIFLLFHTHNFSFIKQASNV